MKSWRSYNWFSKLAGETKLAADEQQALSGPIVDNIISTVHDMLMRGAPIEKNDYGFNGTDYTDATSGMMAQLLAYSPGSEVPVPLLVHAVQVLWKYDVTQLGGQARQLRTALQEELQKLAPQPQPQQPQPQQPQQQQTDDRKVRILGWGTGYNRDLVRIYIPDADNRLTPRTVNKLIRENADSLGWEEEEQDITLPNGMVSTKYDYPLNKLRKKDKEGFDTWMIHKDFVPVLTAHLQAMNATEAQKAPRARPPREPFIWDLSELEGFDSATAEQPKPQVRIRMIEGDFGNEYFVGFDLTPGNFLQEFKNFVKETLDWWWPKWTGNENKEWHLRGTKNDNFELLAGFFEDHGYDATPLHQIAQQLTEQTDGKTEPEEQPLEQQLVPLMVRNVSGEGRSQIGKEWHAALSIPRIAPDMRKKYYNAIKFSFPLWMEQRYLDNTNFVYYVKGTYGDFADFGRIMRELGFDVRQLRQVFGELLKAGILEKTRLNGELDGFENAEQLRLAAQETLQPGFELFDAQTDGVQFLYGRNTAFLGDETGAGKTIQAIVAASLRMAQNGSRALIVTLNATKEQWKREIQKFTGDNSISDNPEDGARWTVITYPMLSAPKNGNALAASIQKQKYGIAIYDEVHNTKNQSKRTERIHGFGDTVPFKWGLSATVSANYPIDVWRQLKTIGHRLGDLTEGQFRSGVLDQVYKKHRFGGDWVNKGQSKEEQEENGLRAAAFLNEWLTKYAGIYLRRSKKDINPEVASHTVTETPVELKPAQLKRFNAAVNQRMSQYADPDLAISSMIAERTEMAKAKVPYTLELAGNVLEQDKKVLIFTCFRESAAELEAGAQKLLSKSGGQVVSILGGDQQRQAKLDSFKNDPNTKVMILSILAGGTGIDLPNIVEDVIMNDYSWTPKDAEQAEGRAYRVTSERDINTRYVLATGTVDEGFYDLVQLKRRLAERIDHATDPEDRVKALRELKAANSKMRDLAREYTAGKKKGGKTASSWLARVV